jgi:hypothetical protein
MMLSDDEIFVATRQLLPDAIPTTQRRLQKLMLTGTHTTASALPVLRVGFDDPTKS